MKFSNIFFLASIILILNCVEQKNNNIEVVTNFPEPIDLKEEIILEDQFGNFFIKPLDSLLLLSTIQLDSLYHVYNEDLYKIGVFGKIGPGPDELLIPYHIYDNTNSSVFIFDAQLLKLKEIDLTLSIDSSRIIVKREINLPREFIGLREIFYLDKANLIGIYDDHIHQRIDSKKGIVIYNFQKDEYDIIELINFKLNPYDRTEQININSRTPVLSRNNNKLALISVHAPLLEIIDINTKEKRNFILEEDSKLDLEYPLSEFIDMNLIQYYVFATANDDNIYLLYRGSNELTAPDNFYIKVITWDGIPIEQYKVNGNLDISMISIDVNENYIYAISFNNDEIYRFKLDN
ncbi:MAG: hypothetical protein ED557_13670 [Balneola sp.]|nr:MAG: hypothetical protein ED557_13670 [Balneola sp.]